MDYSATNIHHSLLLSTMILASRHAFFPMRPIKKTSFLAETDTESWIFIQKFLGGRSNILNEIFLNFSNDSKSFSSLSLQTTESNRKILPKSFFQYSFYLSLISGAFVQKSIHITRPVKCLCTSHSVIIIFCSYLYCI